MKLRKHNKFNVRIAVIIAAVVSAAGILILPHTLATVNLVAFEAELSSISGGAKVVNNTAASAGMGILFATPATPAPTPTPTPTSTPGTGQFSYSQVLAWVDAFAATHTGKATDINHPAATSYNEPAAVQLRAVCGTDWTAVYPRLAWEYGGTDHAWINPTRSPLLICVHHPIKPPYPPEWSFISNHVVAVVYTMFPAQSPCADQLLPCMTADSSNFEILVDEAGGGANNGSNVGIDTSNASTELKLRRANGTLEHLWSNL